MYLKCASWPALILGDTVQLSLDSPLLIPGERKGGWFPRECLHFPTHTLWLGISLRGIIKEQVFSWVAFGWPCLCTRRSLWCVFMRWLAGQRSLLLVGCRAWDGEGHWTGKMFVRMAWWYLADAFWGEFPCLFLLGTTNATSKDVFKKKKDITT